MVGTFTLGPSWASAYLDLSGQLQVDTEFLHRWSRAGGVLLGCPERGEQSFLSALAIPSLQGPLGHSTQTGLQAPPANQIPNRGKGCLHFLSRSGGLWHGDIPGTPDDSETWAIPIMALPMLQMTTLLPAGTTGRQESFPS